MGCTLTGAKDLISSKTTYRGKSGGREFMKYSLYMHNRELMQHRIVVCASFVHPTGRGEPFFISQKVVRLRNPEDNCN